MHRRQQIPRFLVHRAIEPAEQCFQGRQQQREGRAQFMADVGEEPALDLVQFLQLLVAFLQRLAVLVQFIPKDKFPEAPPAVHIASSHNNDACQCQKVEVVGKSHPGNVAVQCTGDDVHEHYQGDCNQAFGEGPIQNEADQKQHEIKSCVVGRPGPFRHVNHP